MRNIIGRIINYYPRRKENPWIDDEEKKFEISPQIVKAYFNKTQSLVFGEDSARKEERAISPFIKVTPEFFKVLDLGCGDGRWAEILVKRCAKYVGVDFSMEFIEAARKRMKSEKVKFVCMPAQNYVADEQYNLILMIGLMTYMNDDEIAKLSNNCRGMLASGGRLIVRNITLENGGCKRKIYNRSPNIIKKLLGRDIGYQIIRRSMEEELSLFKKFHLLHTERIEGTGYRFYVFE